MTSDTSDAPHGVKIQTVGNGPGNLVFLHGLMGRGKNFARFARELSGERRVLLVDLPNHGASAWTDSFDYKTMAAQVSAAIDAELGEQPYDLVGHSMGGKVAMTMALTDPELIQRLMVVDIAPAHSWESGGEFPHLLGSLKSVDLESVAHRTEVDEQLAGPIPHPTVRGFLMQNLRHHDGRFTWQPNLDLLYDNLDTIGGFPDFKTTFDRPVIWVAGSESRYIQDKDRPMMQKLFPQVRKVTVKGAGHWVHSQKPAEFTQLLRYFLD
ncbi:alpha/beta fold hydrolase [Kocuria coralli]|uniref:Alpha/beta fold hydrolase n=1 Tax=Kocuria coralli TaxID=1461025 RepID=A0A5J5KVE6_9MICC|nr:alpha/beta fold hydrolase [Kocuria coralli]KAA9393368.1 alpha/beta fold hydrolase [Kocuria coralli]